MSRIALGILMLLLTVAVRAQVVALDPAIQGQPLGANMQYWADQTGRASLSDVMAGVPWQTGTADVPSFGFTRTVYWFRLDVQVADLREPWLLEVGYNLLDEVRFYQVGDMGKVLAEETLGMLHPEPGSGRFQRMFVVPVAMEKPGLVQVFLQIRSDHALQVPVYLWRSSEYIAQNEQDNIALGIFFGVYGILTLYNFFIYTLTREKIYLTFVVMSATLIFFHAQVRSLGVRMMFPEWVEWNGPLLLLSCLVGAYTLASHAEQFLDLEKTDFPLKRIYVHLRWMCLASAALILWSRTEYGVYLMGFLISVTSLVTFFAVLYCYRPNDRPLYWFAVAWGLFSLGICTLLANKLGLLPFNVITEHTISVTGMIGMLLISMAMSDRHNQQIRGQIALMKHNQLTVEQSAETEARSLRNLEMQRTAADISLRLQAENNERLLREMDDREQEVEAAVQRLREAARIDALTTTFNRSYFNERLTEEFERAIRSGQRLSLILLGISQVDEFVQRFGFKAGDEVVRQAAEVVDGITRHHCASVYRYEEDVFAVMLPGLNVQRVQAVADTIRTACQNQPFLFGGQRLDVSISVAMGSQLPALGSRPEQLVAEAEKALHAARQRQELIMASDSGKAG